MTYIMNLDVSLKG